MTKCTQTPRCYDTLRKSTIFNMATRLQCFYNSPWCLLILLLLAGAHATPGDNRRIPCYNCTNNSRYRREDYHQMNNDRRQLPIYSYCQKPCNSCSNVDVECKAGVSIIRDGCNCCSMCARQQGDLCNDRDRCDENKNLFCDRHTGICKSKSQNPCSFNGVTYRDGEKFSLNCSKQCNCQNGQVSCTSLCPHEDHPPSRLHCPKAMLVKMGSCCHEWVCPHAINREGLDDQPAQSLEHELSNKHESRGRLQEAHDGMEPVFSHLRHGRFHSHKQRQPRLSTHQRSSALHRQTMRNERHTRKRATL